eukprot:1159058-Pelagomonas_calceolata.AAC.7
MPLDCHAGSVLHPRMLEVRMKLVWVGTQGMLQHGNDPGMLQGWMAMLSACTYRLGILAGMLACTAWWPNQAVTDYVLPVHCVSCALTSRSILEGDAASFVQVAQLVDDGVLGAGFFMGQIKGGL